MQTKCAFIPNFLSIFRSNSQLNCGKPGLCKETAAGSEIFTRGWTKASVQMNCKSYEAKVTLKSTGGSVF